MRRSPNLWLWWLWILAGLQGCGMQPSFQVLTVVHGDGSCERTIWQPNDTMLPDEASRDDWKSRWSLYEPSGVPPAFDGKPDPNEPFKYFKASGSFRRVEEIPNHFRYEIGQGSIRGVSELVRSLDRRDYTFVIEHRWIEKLTNIVSPEGFVKARDGLLDAGIPIFIDALNQIYGESYDIQGLTRYLRGDGRRFLVRVSDAWYESCAAHEPEKSMMNRLAVVAREFGLDLLDDSGNLLPPSEHDERFFKFFRHRLLLGARHRDGKRLSEPEIAKLVKIDQSSPAYDAWNRYFKGHQAEIETLLVSSGLKMCGLYNIPLGSSRDPRFVFDLRLPGEIVETGGSTEKGSETRWRFDGDRSFPDGYAMQARSLEIDRDSQRQILGRIAIDDIDKAITFVSIVGASPVLQAEFLKLRTAGTIKGLEALNPSNELERERATQVRRLLGLAQ